MKRASKHLRLQEARRLIGISYPTLKQWIYRGKIKAMKTAGGHYRIPESEVARLCRVKNVSDSDLRKPLGIDAISGRNKLLGRVVDVEIDGLLAQVTLDIGNHLVSAILTRDACNELGLKEGVSAYALIKSTEVMMVRA